MADMAVDGAGVYSREASGTAPALFAHEQVQLLEAGFAEGVVLARWLGAVAKLTDGRVDEVEDARRQLTDLKGIGLVDALGHSSTL